MFSLRSFLISVLTFRSLIHFEFIFVCSVREYSKFTLLHVAVQLSQHQLKRLSFLHCIVWSPCHRLVGHKCVGLFLGFLICFIGLYVRFCPYHTILITIPLQYSLKSGNLILPVQLFFFQIALATWGLWCEKGIFKCISEDIALGILIGIELILQISLESTVIFITLSSKP